jgi:hypothetical protein
MNRQDARTVKPTMTTFYRQSRGVKALTRLVHGARAGDIRKEAAMHLRIVIEIRNGKWRLEVHVSRH